MFEVGSEVAGYGVESVLGAGGMGEVYRVRHPRLPRSDALKVLRSAHAGDPVVRARFEREADLVAPLVHPNLVRVYDRGAFDDVLWIAMELVPGTDASNMVKHSPAGLDARLVVNIVDGAAAALDLAHRHGVLHRDVKPANILITPGQDPIVPDAVKVTDFGIAQALGDASGGLTHTGATVGTMRYCSPEQIDGRAVDGRADVYSLAATAFELLTGSSPYDSTSLQGLMTAHLFAEPPRASERNRSLSSAVDAVLAFGLAKDPAQRPPTCSAFAQALRAALFSGTGPSVPPSFANTPGAPVHTAGPGGYAPPTGIHPMAAHLAGTAPQQAATPWYRRVPVVATAAIVAAAAIGIGGGFAWASGGGLSTPSNLAVEMTVQGVDLSWDAVPGADSYLIKEDDTVIRTVAGTSYTHTQVFPGSHAYSVAAQSTTDRGSDFSEAAPVDVTLTWGALGEVAAAYPDLLPASPVSTSGYDGLDCRAEGPYATDSPPTAVITCEKLTEGVDKYTDALVYAVQIGVVDAPDDVAGAVSHRADWSVDVDPLMTTAQGDRGIVRVDDDAAGSSRAVFRFTGLDDDDVRSRTYVEVSVPGKDKGQDALDRLERLPI